MKKLSDFFSISVVFFFIIVIWGFYVAFIKQSKFEAQHLDVSLEEFKDNWGKPNKEFISEPNRKILFYECHDFYGYIMDDKYVFEFNSKNNKLIAKFYDD